MLATGANGMPRLRGLIRSGQREGQEAISGTGRRCLMARQDQPLRIEVEREGAITMSEGHGGSRVGRAGMRRRLRLRFPAAGQALARARSGGLSRGRTPMSHPTAYPAQSSRILCNPQQGGPKSCCVQTGYGGLPGSNRSFQAAD